MNILILSCGTRNKIVQYFRQALHDRGLVVATDSSRLAPALYEADKHYIVPRVDSNGYLSVILDICRKEQISGVLSLIDPELSVLSQHKQKLIDIGVTPIVSDHKAVELCFDKYLMAKFLNENGFFTAKSYLIKEEFYTDVDAGNISYPVFVKPVKGSASVNINKVYSEEEVELLFSRFDGLMIQEFMDGTEIGVDAYIDLISGELTAIFAKEKIKMRAGETDKSVSIKDKVLFDLIHQFVKKANLRGIIDIDLFRINGNYYISEVNPRFGGGYPHAHECGVNMIEMLLQNIRGEQNTPIIGHYDEGVYMMKYNEVFVKRIPKE